MDLQWTENPRKIRTYQIDIMSDKVRKILPLQQKKQTVSANIYIIHKGIGTLLYIFAVALYVSA